MNQTTRLTLALALSLALIPAVGHAQYYAGGNDPFSGVLQWMQGSLVTTLSTLGVVVLGVTLLAMRWSLVAIATICVGIWVIFNPTTILNMIPHGG